MATWFRFVPPYSSRGLGVGALLIVADAVVPLRSSPALPSDMRRRLSPSSFRPPFLPQLPSANASPMAPFPPDLCWPSVLSVYSLPVFCSAACSLGCVHPSLPSCVAAIDWSGRYHFFSFGRACSSLFCCLCLPLRLPGVCAPLGCSLLLLAFWGVARLGELTCFRFGLLKNVVRSRHFALVCLRSAVVVRRLRAVRCSSAPLLYICCFPSGPAFPSPPVLATASCLFLSPWFRFDWRSLCRLCSAALRFFCFGVCSCPSPSFFRL